ncbi:MAG: hypothetical protein J5736_05475, partial [Bacilli bacterium]|nr:hypothetical protein [Bacilli bacterium]
RKKGVRIDGRITTNFYALTLPNFKKLVESGITYFQITLDGFEDTHDFYRPLTGGGKTYQRILDNLIACQESDLDFKVVIRTNFDAKTDYKPFINSLRRFKGDNRFVFSINEIFAGSPIDPELICSREGALIKRKELVKAYHKAGLPLNETDEKIGFFLPCYACQKNTAIVDAEGRVRKCTLHLEDPKNDLGNFENFSSLNDGFWVGPRFSDCELCRFYPICLGRMCRYRTLANRKECEDQRLKEYAILNDE